MDRKSIIGRIVTVLIGIAGISHSSYGDTNCNVPNPHLMQHGFILAPDEITAVHLVANGHHSRQVVIAGALGISDENSLESYKKLRAEKNHTHYFLLQAQNLELRCVKAGDTLSGHIVIALRGEYSPDNVVVEEATFTVSRVQLNINNPFFN